jgi:5'(3')-deoxyribonucleotidase
MKVFCDMDGVLTDFPSQYNHRREYFGKPPIPLIKFNEEDFPHYVEKTAREIDAELDYMFWANLPWMKHGRALLNLLEQMFGRERICLLSFPSYSPQGPAGKIAWVRRELPSYEMRLILATDKRFCASPDAILFDDKPRNAEEFTAAGGWSVVVPAPWNCAGSVTMEKFMHTIEQTFRSVKNSQ